MILLGSLIGNLGLLGFFKYFNFFISGFSEAFSLFGDPFKLMEFTYYTTGWNKFLHFSNFELYDRCLQEND